MENGPLQEEEEEEEKEKEREEEEETGNFLRSLPT